MTRAANDHSESSAESSLGSSPASALSRRWPLWLRRGRMELLACLLIGIGLVMMLQPLALILFTWSFVTTLFGTVMFMVVSKFPE